MDRPRSTPRSLYFWRSISKQLQLSWMRFTLRGNWLMFHIVAWITDSMREIQKKPFNSRLPLWSSRITFASSFVVGQFEAHFRSRRQFRKLFSCAIPAYWKPPNIQLELDRAMLSKQMPNELWIRCLAERALETQRAWSHTRVKQFNSRISPFKSETQ